MLLTIIVPQVMIFTVNQRPRFLHGLAQILLEKLAS